MKLNMILFYIFIVYVILHINKYMNYIVLLLHVKFKNTLYYNLFVKFKLYLPILLLEIYMETNCRIKM